MTDLVKAAAPYEARTVVDDLGKVSLEVWTEASLPPDPVPPDPGPDPGPEVGWPPGQITDLAANCSADALQNAINSCQQGNSVRLAPGTVNLGGRSIRLKSGVCVHANGLVKIVGGPGPGSAGAFDGGGLSGWAITGEDPDKGGFDFDRTLINASAATGYGITCVDIHDVASNGYDGSAIRIGNSRNGVIVNCDLWSCIGNVIGMYNMDTITFDGIHMDSCAEGFPIHSNSGTGNHLHWLRCCFSNMSRACIEVGPSTTASEPFDDLHVEDCWFVDFAAQGAGTMLPISLVGQSSKNTVVKNNYCDRGMGAAAGAAAIAIEFTGSGECTGNTCVNFAWAGLLYKSGWNIHDNHWYVQGGQPKYAADPGGYDTNQAGASGTRTNNSFSTTIPTRPPKPARVAASTYYPKLLRRRWGSRREVYDGR
jgi:hypothetical protein